MSVLEKLFNDVSGQFLKRQKKTLEKVNALEGAYKELTDKQLKERALKLREEINEKVANRQHDPLAMLETSDRVREKKEINVVLDKFLPDVFAMAREAARRTVNQRHFDVQILGGIALHQGNIAEMRTGEGKTLVATLPLALNGMLGRGAHLVTVNDYLAKRDAETYAAVYEMLGLSVGVITHDSSFRYEKGEMVPVTRREAYACDITYGTNNEFGFDYLRDNMVQDASQLVQREQYFAIVDEVDSILIDEARTPLIISGPAEESADTYQQFAKLVPRLKKEEDYTVDEKDRVVSLTQAGISKMEQLLGVENIYGEEVQLAYHLEEALKAQILFRRDKEYIVKDGEVIIIDEHTGRLMPGRRYSEGLHQAIEAKEGVRVQRENNTLGTISFQNLFRLYTKLGGMTGTAATESEEFMKIYGLEVISIPTNRAMIRKDHPDRIYKTEMGKYKAVIADIKAMTATGRPILLGTISVEKNEYLGELLKRSGIKHEILNAKNNEREAHIIAEAGRKGAVTLATNIAGRGTDIILGGVPPKRDEFESDADFEKAREKWQKNHDEVVELGGLHVIGTERHESRRIDNQLRGRAGRQGDPGSSQFYVSAEDDLMRIFGGDRMKNWLGMMGVSEEEAIEHSMLTKSLESAQKRVEGFHFDSRKRVVQYDDVLNRHREVIYRRRRKMMLKPEDVADIEEAMTEALRHEARHLAGLHASGYHTEWNLERLTRDLAAFTGMTEAQRSALQEEMAKYSGDAAVESRATEVLEEAYNAKKQQFESVYPYMLRAVYLGAIDMLWVEHLNAMQELRNGVGLQSYAQTEPLLVYKSEGHRLFQQLLTAIDLQTVRTVLRVQNVQTTA